MQVSDKLREFWNAHKEQGDVNQLAKETGLDYTTVSRILSGKIDRTSTKVAMVISKFYKKRHREVKKTEALVSDQN